MERKENQITLRGTAAETPTLSHQSRGLDFYRFPLSVPRLSGKEDRLNIFVPSGLPLPREGDYVEISTPQIMCSWTCFQVRRGFPSFPSRKNSRNPRLP